MITPEKPSRDKIRVIKLINLLSQLLTNNPSRALHRQYIFWASLLLPLGLFLAVGSLYWEGYKFSWTKEGIDTFFDISKTPLYFLSSVIPLMILAARIHATRQVEEQIKVTQENNTFTNYYKHRELFQDFFDEQLKDFEYELNAESLYKLLYPKNNAKHFGLDSALEYHHKSTFENYNDLIESIYNGKVSAEAIHPIEQIFHNMEIFSAKNSWRKGHARNVSSFLHCLIRLFQILSLFTHDNLNLVKVQDRVRSKKYDEVKLKLDEFFEKKYGS
ncbi:hypothetical protein [Pseudoalteromonas luteoviolacea]|uniref:hypothetical protein n=1 Tax=Pseudoalteromonas luteoviolacea TaxID=43657 RepID=UPI001B3830B4|nr:hypothetical protein [Pseudoalteromonas luteoviolacea]MBQ4838823.1 hypothetical protein [Pseudoalteromonas luteoviolacea]